MNTRQPIRHLYKLCKVFETVRHFELFEVTNGTAVLTPKININKDRQYSNAKDVFYWLKLFENDKWTKVVTGLKVTPNKRLYYGDLSEKQNGIRTKTNLLIFAFTNDCLIIDVFPYYYPESVLNEILQGYHKDFSKVITHTCELKTKNPANARLICSNVCPYGNVKTPQR